MRERLINSVKEESRYLPKEHRISIAPMMDWTDRHYRYFMRLLSKRTLLYTEMVTTGALLHGSVERHLDYHPAEHPIALQLGGDNPDDLSVCAKLAEEWGYDEINLNLGCPSDRVQKGAIGAILMKNPARVRDCVAAMKEVTDLPVTVKHRIGVDDLDRYEDMHHFVETVAESGADRFTVHARKAWLSGLSPKANREIPPLRYHDVYRLKEEFPDLLVEINGGIQNLDEAEEHLEHVDAVMLGRSAYYNPILFASVDHRFFGDEVVEVDKDYLDNIINQMMSYTDEWLQDNPESRVHHITRHILHLFDGYRGARRFRQHLSTAGADKDASPQIILEAYEEVKRYLLET